MSSGITNLMKRWRESAEGSRTSLCTKISSTADAGLRCAIQNLPASGVPSAPVGLLVDDAIVEIENIERHVRTGKPLLESIADAVSEIALAVLATTMSLVVVFLPTAFMSGVPGLLFRQFGWTAVIAVLASLLVARLLTPLMGRLHAQAPPS